MKRGKSGVAIAVILVAAMLLMFAFAACQVQFQLKFVVDGEVYHTIDTNGEEAVTLPADPTKDGYIFDGWYWDEDIWAQPFTAESLLTVKLTGNMSVYAKWVSSDNTGCAIIDSGDMTMDGKTLSIELPNAQTAFAFSEQLTVSPYALYEISTDIEGRDVIPSATAELEEGDNVFYIQIVSGTGFNRAQYKAVVRRREIYTVTYNFGGGAADATEQVEEDQLAPSKDASREGYTFGGWQHQGEAWDFAADKVVGDMTLTAVWNANGYQVTFDSAGGNEIDAAEVTFGEEFTFEVPTRLGYTFGGWKTEDEALLTDGEGVGVGAWDIAADTALTAMWTVNTYNIEYKNMDGALNAESNPVSYTIEDDTIVLQDASREGYDFVGWYDGEQKVTEIASGSHGDRTLTAKWQAVGYTIFYEGLGGGTHSNATEYTIESDTIVLQGASREGYDFVGWYDGEQKVTEIATGSHGDIVLTAKWQIVEYSVDYDLDGGVNAAGNPSSYTVLTLGGADGSIALADPSKVVVDYASNGDGSFEVAQNVYTFLGWYKDALFEQEVTALTLGLGDVTLYAKWSEPVTQTETKQYVRVNKNNEGDAQGEYILFGEYPQTIKSSDVTVGDVADEDGYYLGSDGERYAKVVADPYVSGYTFSDGSNVTSGNTYYFKVEPIRWRILSESDGSAFILADGIIANHYYHHTTSSTTIEGETVDTNNYKHSDIRAWLNGEFLHSAFGEVAQGLIKTTEVDNSVYSTGYSSNQYACENTFDKVFLLSYREVVTSEYGFSSDYSDYDTARRMTVSDYARSTGAYMNTSNSYFGCGYWWLRSPYNDYYSDARYVSLDGYAGYSNYVDLDYRGVVPALNITL